MRIEIFVIVCAMLGISVAMAACSTGDAVSRRPSPQAGASPMLRVEVEPSPSPNSPIRSIDFANFTYPANPGSSDGTNNFTLQHGRYNGNDGQANVNLAYLAYGDVTGDGVEEAIVVLGISVRGTATPHIAYIYVLQNNGTKLLWSFQTGDRGAGGLRQVYAENGALVIELYGESKVIGRNLYGQEVGVCCPRVFTRARYQWQGNSFRQQGGEETLPNPESGASVVMPRYGSSG
jgi:hypothetical protein